MGRVLCGLLPTSPNWLQQYAAAERARCNCSRALLGYSAARAHHAEECRVTMQVPTSRYLMVVLEPGLDHSRITGLFHNMMLLPGVLSVTDMSMITQETVDAILMLPDETVQAEIRAKELMATRQRAWQRRLIDG